MPDNNLIQTIFNEFETLVNEYNSNPEDFAIANGNVGLCIITSDGNIYGKQFGTDPIKQRFFYNMAWQKASQVRITNIATGDFEQLVFNSKVTAKQFGLKRHDLIGWKGGLPIHINNTNLYIGFSGYREDKDIEIINRAITNIF